MLVIDDVMLLRVLARTADPPVAAAVERGEVFATACWFSRLSRAVHDQRYAGQLTRTLDALEEEQRHQVIELLDELPDQIGLLSWRTVVPVMRVLHVERPLNLLAAEALATSVILDAQIVVTTDTPLIRTGAESLGLEYRVA
ncbi:MAG: hypothetical protein U5R31_15140 [Acidimicrobiia bacterium]|nr:hypothetical protein [Acidimicrobiia bacterium]